MSEKNGGETPPGTAVALDEDQDDDWIERRRQIWTKEQELIASMVQVYSDENIESIPRPREQRESNHPPSTAIVVQDNPFYKVLRQRSIDSDGRFHRYFGGVDVGFVNPLATNSSVTDGSTCDHEPPPAAVAVYVVIDATTMSTVYRDHVWIRAKDLPPYVSGFLAFREIYPLERLVRKQMESDPAVTPSAILVDGNGIFHPRHAGLACFLGVRTGLPTIGIGKTLLYIEKNGRHGNSDGGVDEYQWTRKKLDARIDRVLRDVHQKIITCSTGNDETDSQDHQRGKESTKTCEEYKGVILPRIQQYNDETIGEGMSEPPDQRGFASREELLKELAPFCNGIAIPLEAPPQTRDSDSDSDSHNSNVATTTNHDRFRVLGTALVGHGRAGEKRLPQFLRSASCAKKSTRPIIVSVGHKSSPAKAASIVAHLSVFRIPEPVRQADLYGRELLRQRKLL